MSSQPATTPGAVFLSYAREDSEAARRIADALRAFGVEVWFDQNELRGGDAWDAKIRKQIKECALFVPVISANTNARPEGYFRLEWLLAVERARLMADDHPFLFPIAIGDVNEATARVPERFRDVQWTRVRLDETPTELAARITRLLGGAAGKAVEARGVSDKSTAAAAGRGRTRRWWMVFPVIGIITGLGFAVLPLWKALQRAAGGGVAPAVPAPISEARQLVAKARAVFEEGDLVNRETYVLAEALLKKAEELDMTDAEAWSLHATLSGWMLGFGFDNSAERRDAFRAQAERAIKLAPQASHAQLAYAEMLLRLGQNTTDADQILERLNQRNPDDWRVLRLMARSDRREGQIADAVSLLQRARRLSNDDPRVTGDLLTVLLAERRFAEGEAVIAEALAKRSSGRVLEFDVRTKASWRGDAKAAAAAMERWPSWMFSEDRGAQCAALVWMYAREPGKGLAVVGRFPRDYFRHNRFTGPRAALTAWLHELAGNPLAAQSDWRTALQVANRELASAPENGAAMHWKAWALARLGDRMAAEKLFQELTERRDMRIAANESTAGLVGLALTLGKTEWALSELQNGFAAKSAPTWATRAVLELNPCFDSLRKDPRFQALVATAAAPEPAKAAAAGVPAPDAKSVVVLPFANLSGDKEHEYFSDGLTEEILNALQRESDLHVPGRGSAFSFKGKNLPAPEIARVLNVAQVVEGSVRKAGNHVRITATLTRAADGFSQPLGSFDKELTDGSAIFAFQEEVARAVVQKLTLRQTTAAPVVVLTKNTEAYFEYLRGRELLSQPQRAWRQAIAALGRATELDPKFALAWALRGASAVELHRSLLYVPGLVNGRQDIEEALRLQPDLPEAQLGRANLLRVAYAPVAEIERALDRARGDRPETFDLMRFRAAIVYSSAGRLDDAARLLQRAMELDPRNGGTLNVLGILLHAAGRYAEAEKAYERAAELLGANASSPLINRASTYLDWKGDYALVLRTLDSAPAGIREFNYWRGRAELLYRLGEGQAALAAAAQLPQSVFGTLFLQAQIHEAMGSQAAARAAYAAALPLAEKRRDDYATISSAHAILSLVYAGLDRKDDALAAARRSLEIVHPADYPGEAAGEWGRAGAWTALAQVQARFGMYEEALRIVAAQSAAGFWRRNYLLLNPDWAFLQKDPRFRAIAEKAPL